MTRGCAGSAAARLPWLPDTALVLAAAFAFYALTLAPTVVWGDSASLSWRAFLGTFRIGTAEDHPVFLLVAWLFARLPGEVARNVNLAAATFGALAVATIHRCGRLLGAGRVGAVAGAAALCVSHAFWLHAVVAEVYTANAFFLAALFCVLLEWRRRGGRSAWFALAVVTFLVGLANHLVLVSVVPAVAAFVLATKGRALFTPGVLWAGASLLGLAVLMAVAPPAPIAAAIARLWDGPAPVSEYVSLTFQPAAVAREAAFYLLFLAYQFPSVSLLLGGAGAVLLWRRDRAAAALLLLAMACNAFIFIRHTVWPSTSGTKYVFYIADYTIFAMLVGVGAGELTARLRGRWSAERHRLAVAALLGLVAVAPPVIYAGMPAMTRRAGIELFSARGIAYRDNTRFFLNPNKRGDVGARRFAEEAFAIVPSGAVIFADHTPYAVLRYLQLVEGRRPDVLVPRLGGGLVRVRWIERDGRPRPTYLAAAPRPGYYDLTALGGNYDLVRAGPLLEVRPRKLPASH